MSSVIACIDGSVYSCPVADYAAWAAKRLGASVELLQVLGRREASSQDRSGRIIAGARRHLLAELSRLDEERSKLLQQQGWLDLEEAEAQVRAGGVEDVTTALRYGDLLETLLEREANADMLVVGKRGAAADFAKLHLGSNVERVLRATSLPVLVSARSFTPVKRVMIAFDGRPSAQRAVEELARSPMLAGLGVVLIRVGDRSAEHEQLLDAAANRLRGNGMTVEVEIVPGAAIDEIPKAVREDEIDLLVMGAYGHSRLRTLVIGSTTSEMIRECRIPILIYR
ncbi:universal stress protein [Rhodobacteraceae bacterium NNCM2]|nr:universal stress protein [Coraliihabitans acroporae]